MLTFWTFLYNNFFLKIICHSLGNNTKENSVFDKKLVGKKWLMLADVFFFGILIPPHFRQVLDTILLFQAKFISLHWK